MFYCLDLTIDSGGFDSGGSPQTPNITPVGGLTLFIVDIFIYLFVYLFTYLPLYIFVPQHVYANVRISSHNDSQR